MTPSLVSISLLEQLIELKKILRFTSLLQQDIIKDTDARPDGRDTQGDVCEKLRASMPCLGGRSVSTPICSPIQKLSEPCTLGILWLQHMDMIDH